MMLDLSCSLPISFFWSSASLGVCRAVVGGLCYCMGSINVMGLVPMSGICTTVIPREEDSIGLHAPDLACRMLVDGRP
jgi:hypothetical protein